MRLFEQGSKGMLRSDKADLREDELFIHSPNIYFGCLQNLMIGVIRCVLRYTTCSPKQFHKISKIGKSHKIGRRSVIVQSGGRNHTVIVTECDIKIAN